MPLDWRGVVILLSFFILACGILYMGLNTQDLEDKNREMLSKLMACEQDQFALDEQLAQSERSENDALLGEHQVLQDLRSCQQELKVCLIKLVSILEE